MSIIESLARHVLIFTVATFNLFCLYKELTMSNPPIMKREITPNLFASVMGTGIIANAAAGLPIFGQYLTGFAVVVWLIASFMLITLTVGKIIQTIIKPHIIIRQINDPIIGQFFGAPPMALLTIAGGTVLLGDHILAKELIAPIAWSLWLTGSLLGGLSAITITYHLFTRYEVKTDGAFGGWLMPVVPPMVSAAIGALMIPMLDNLALQQLMLYGCYALFGCSLFAAMIITTMIWSRLTHSGSSGGARVPTLWIVLGPLGQSITAAGALGSVSLMILEPSLGNSFNNMALLYGLPVWGFAFFWTILAILLTLRAIKRKMPFALTWWAFVFPVGTCVTGTSQIAAHTQSVVFEWAAVLLFSGLLVAWLVAAIGSLTAIKKGTILHTPQQSPHAVSAKNKPL